MARIRPKDTPIDAVQITEDIRNFVEPLPDWAEKNVQIQQIKKGVHDYGSHANTVFLKTCGGTLIALKDGDWVIRGRNGWHSVCPKGTFKFKFDIIEE